MDITKAKEILGDLFSFTAEDTDRVIKYLNLPKDSTILDVGTGYGNLAITLALNGYRVWTGEPETDDSHYANHDWLQNAKKVGVDHLIEFKAFDVKDLPFENDTFHAIFFLGSFHHIEEADRINVLKECTRASKPNAILCFFEPNRKSMEMIKAFDPSHPDAANPNHYSRDLDLESNTIEGTNFNMFIFNKQ